MNKRRIGIALGTAALGIALVALPGSSARRQEQSKPVMAGIEAKLCELESRAQSLQDSAMNMAAQRKALSQLEDFANFGSEDGQEMQVFVGSSGGWLGVGVTEVTADKVKELKLPAERGALLGKIIPDSPAAKAGLKENDVVTEINGQRVEGTEQFRRMIREIPAGRTARLTLWRDGRAQEVQVTLSKVEARHGEGMMATPGMFEFRMPEMPELPAMGDEGLYNFSFAAQPRIGIDAESLDGELGNYFGAPEGRGILVRGVFPDSPAAKAGLKAGDVITSVNGERIQTVHELREKLVEKNAEKNVKLGLLRNKTELSLTVELPTPAKQPERHLTHRTNI